MIILIYSQAFALDQKRIAITQIVAHQALDRLHQGVIDGLKHEHFINKQDIIIDYQNANGDIALANRIAKKFVSQNSDIIIAIVTQSSQAEQVLRKKTDIP